MRIKILTLFLSFLFWTSSASAEILQPGSLDPSYGVNGLAYPSVGTSSVANAAVLQTDGKMVVGGYSMMNGKKHLTLARYTTDGKLDSSFGQNGIVILNASEIGGGNKNGDDEIYSMILQGDKILVAGYITYTFRQMNKNILLMRFKGDGTLDTSFGNNGVVARLNAFASEVVNSIDLQSNGNIIINIMNDIDGKQKIKLARLDPNGIIDANFGNSPDFFIFDRLIHIRTVKVQTGQKVKDKIVIAGSSGMIDPKTPLAFIARIDPDGKDFDLTFSDTNTGAKVIDLSQNGKASEFQAISFQPDGKIVMGGNTEDDFVLSRCNENCDEATPEFMVKTDIENGSVDRLTSVALQADGKIVAFGFSNVGISPETFSLARYDSKGVLDTSFNTTGKVVTKFPNGVLSQGKSLLIQSDGKLLATGFTADIQNKQFAIARYFDKPTEYPPVSPNSSSGGGSGGCAINSTNPANLGILFLLFIPLTYIGLRSRKLLTVKK